VTHTDVANGGVAGVFAGLRPYKKQQQAILLTPRWQNTFSSRPMIPTMSHTVGQLAKLTGLSVRSLHHYDETGLLCPSDRSDAGYRLYSTADVERLYQIQALRWLDLPLVEVKDILARGGAAIPHAVDQKIASLTEQVEKANDLRTRLMNLRARHFQGQSTGTDQLLAAVELFKHYEKHLSADDLGGFQPPTESELDEWRKTYEDVLSALKRNVAPDSDEGQALGYRWGVLTYKMSKGDMSLALKAKVAYENDAGVRRAATKATGSDPAVMQFVLAASQHTHLKLLAKYFAPEEVSRLQLTSRWQAEWLRVASAMREEFKNESPFESIAVQSVANEWSEQLDAFTSGDAMLKAKLLNALQCDAHLQKRWLVSEALLHFAHQATSTTLPGQSQ
jgi:DNA-binding transcriptional MerR regulator